MRSEPFEQQKTSGGEESEPQHWKCERGKEKKIKAEKRKMAVIKEENRKADKKSKQTESL